MKDWWAKDRRGREVAVRPHAQRRPQSSIPAMVEHLESRQFLSGAAVNPTTSAADLGVIQLDAATGAWRASRYKGTQFAQETIATWQTPVADTVVVHGDLWGTGQHELIQFDATTGNFNAEWKSGSAIASGNIASWVPGMDLQFLTVQDLNHDGRDDIIAMDRITGRWAASTSKVGGGYDTRFIGTWQTGVNWQHVSFADLNADGYDDIVGFNSATNTWNALLGKQGDFQAVSTVSPVASGNVAHAVVDRFDGAAGADILVRDSASGNWTKLSYVGGQFSSTNIGTWSPDGTWVDINTIDFWGTGRSAIIGRNAATNEWRLTWSAGSGYATATVSIWGAGTYADAQVADVNLDGREDLIARHVSTGRWYALKSSPTSIQTELIGTWQPNATYAKVWQGDFNGDTKIDLIGLDSSKQTWQGLLSTSGNSYSVQTYVNPEFGFNGTNLSLGDFDADGRLDVIGRGGGTHNWQTLTVTNGQLVANRFDTWTAFGTTWSDQHVIDFNGDGDTDLLARDSATGDWWLTTFKASTPTTAKIANWNPGSTWQSMHTVDFDGNGSVDVIARNATTGDWQLLRSVNGAITSTVIANWSTAVTWTDFQVVDLFGNGRPMIVARNSTTNAWQGVWSVGGGFSTGTLRGMVAGQNYVDTRVVEFFGDGREAVVTRDAQTGAWHALWYGSNRFNLTPLGTWNPNGTWEDVTVVDLEGNGREAIYGHDVVSGEWRRLGFDGVNASNTVVAATTANTSLQLTSVGKFLNTTQDVILSRNAITGNWQRLTFDGANYQLADIGLWDETTTWTTTSVGDFNRDGVADLFGRGTGPTGWSTRTFNGITWSNVAAGELAASAKIVDVPGASDATLRAVILRDLPGLSAALAAGDVRTSARLLRHWVANAADSALLSNPLLWESKGAADAYFGTYVHDSAGSTCGGISEFYVQVLKLFSIDSLTIGLGDVTADLLHTTVVVPIWEQGAWSFDIFDPTFNASFTDSLTNQAATYDQIVSAVKANNSSHILLEENSTANREFLSAVPISSSLLTLENVKNGVYVYRWTDYGIDDYLVTYQDTFAAHRYSPGLTGFLELLPQVKSVYANNGSGNPSISNDQLTSFIVRLATLGIAIPN